MADPNESSSALNPEHEHLLYELETSDTSSVGLVLRAIYDGNKHEKFMEKLDARIKNHDKDIERMCNFHYQGFIESIKALLTVRKDANELKEDICKIDDELQASAATVLKRSEELIKCHKVQSNIASAIESLSLCLPVLETHAKLKRQMKEKRYYPALKTLEQLEHSYLPWVANYQFSQQLRDNIPRLRESIREASMTELTDFLESIRKHSPKVGEVAMRHAAEQNNIVDKNLLGKRRKRNAPPPPNPFTGEVEADPALIESQRDFEEELSAQDLVDFSPVYRCLHIHTALGVRDSFVNHYREQRKEQAQLALDPANNMHETIDGYRNYFQGIVGFFVVEDHILNKTNGLVNRAYLDQVWMMALARIRDALREHSSRCTDANLMLSIKRLVLLFNITLRGYGYPVGRLSDLLLEILDQYNEVLMKKWVQVFRNIFDKDNYHPIEVKTSDEYKAIIKMFPYKDETLEQMSFPKKFPFSMFVPEVYSQVKEYIHACLKFSEDLTLSQIECDDMIRKSTNLLLTRTLGGCLSTLIKKPNLGLLQLIQITINMNYLEDASIYLEDFISSITGSSREGSHVARLQGKTMFKDARADAESQIYLQLNKKIDEFLELASYDWSMVQPSGQASSYLVDLMAFLRSTFQAFTNLPAKVAQTACMSACKHIAVSLLDFLMDDSIKQISQGALEQFNLDVIQCEHFANSEPVMGYEEGSLQMCFADLRQLLDLFMSWDWSTYFHDYNQETSKYLRVSPQSAITLLEKMKDTDKKNVFSVLKKSERDKKKLLDTVLKQLRQLTANGTT